MPTGRHHALIAIPSKPNCIASGNVVPGTFCVSPATSVNDEIGREKISLRASCTQRLLLSVFLKRKSNTCKIPKIAARDPVCISLVILKLDSAGTRSTTKCTPVLRPNITTRAKRSPSLFHFFGTWTFTTVPASRRAYTMSSKLWVALYCSLHESHHTCSLVVLHGST